MQTVAEEVVSQIIDNDIRSRHKIRNRSIFKKVMSYIINNFAAPTNLTGIAGVPAQHAGSPHQARDARKLYRTSGKGKVTLPL